MISHQFSLSVGRRPTHINARKEFVIRWGRGRRAILRRDMDTSEGYIASIWFACKFDNSPTYEYFSPTNNLFSTLLFVSLKKKKKKKEKENKKKEGEVCKIHNSSLQYFCLTCKEAVCSDCAMFGKKVCVHVCLLLFLSLSAEIKWIVFVKNHIAKDNNGTQNLYICF